MSAHRPITVEELAEMKAAMEIRPVSGNQNYKDLLRCIAEIQDQRREIERLRGKLYDVFKLDEAGR